MRLRVNENMVVRKKSRDIKKRRSTCNNFLFIYRTGTVPNAQFKFHHIYVRSYIFTTPFVVFALVDFALIFNEVLFVLLLLYFVMSSFFFPYPSSSSNMYF